MKRRGITPLATRVLSRWFHGHPETPVTNRRHVRRRGVTLLDAVAALVILSLALPTLVGSFVEASTQSIRPTFTTTAAFLATERMEEIIARRNQPGGYAQITAANFPAENPVSGYANYNRAVAVTEVAADLTTPQAGSGLTRVVVTVQWDGGARQVQAARLFADY